ncbi:hypothetical protein [Pseudomonas sp. Irchel 3E19]|uniref:hypothetical protein n=1 Tax=Pseudomonas sp. Irchel 3E19 TaxID=2008981 RepID=UPI000BA39765|nr:hypothetical protein [Pseudomonas sp. Irchel 3E19]
MNTSSDTQRRPGELDPAFGEGGRFALPHSTGSIRSIVADDRGGYILAAWEARECSLYRMFSDGTQDMQFGQNGVSRWAFVPGVDSLPIHLLLQPDGKILLIGKVGNDPFKRQTAFTRFNRSGSPDLVFGNRLIPTVDISTPSACLQADGKILLLVVPNDGGAEETLLYRFLSDGDLDHEFGGQGFLTIRFNNQQSKGITVLSTDDGKILVGGTQRSESGEITHVVIRLFIDGSLDSSFGLSGSWESESDRGMGKVIIDEESIVCVGYEYLDSRMLACISKLTRDGIYASDFNNGKTLAVRIPADTPDWYVTCRSVAVQPDKSIVVGGDAGDDVSAYWLRVLPNGILDPTFGSNGIAGIDQTSALFDIIVQPSEQRILAAVDLDNPRKPFVFGIQL